MGGTTSMAGWPCLYPRFRTRVCQEDCFSSTTASLWMTHSALAKPSIRLTVSTSPCWFLTVARIRIVFGSKISPLE